jgi:hypothetical protein
MNIPIVIVAHKRVSALERLLHSLHMLEFEGSQKMIISIDGGDKQVLRLAKSFQWKHGEKELLVHEPHLGLKQHMLQCMGLGRNYDGIIVLEDDLWVSPLFPSYLKKILAHTELMHQYSGFAFYHQHYYPANGVYRYYNDGLCYRSFYPCSSGFMMFASEIDSFMKWQELKQDEDRILPSFIRLWSAQSWKKCYATYLLANHKQVLYPPASLITNYGDAGAHHSESSSFFQSPMMSESLLESLSLKQIGAYDVYMELTASTIKQHLPELEAFDFEVDLSGSKDLNDIKTPYLLSSKACTKSQKSWSDSLKPIESNLLFNTQGKGIAFGKKESFIENPFRSYSRFLRQLLPPRQLKWLLKFSFETMVNRVFDRKK